MNNRPLERSRLERRDVGGQRVADDAQQRRPVAQLQQQLTWKVLSIDSLGLL